MQYKQHTLTAQPIDDTYNYCILVLLLDLKPKLHRKSYSYRADPVSYMTQHAL